MLATSIFSFSNSVFYPKIGKMPGNHIDRLPCLPFPKQTLYLTCLQDKYFENTVRKGEIALMSNFSFSHSVLYPFSEFCAIFVKFKIVVCKTPSVKSINFVVWEMVKEE